MSTETDRGFLSRWSQRKQAARQQVNESAEEERAEPLEPVSELAGGEPEGGVGRQQPTREEIADANRAAAEAVDLETLGFDSDFSLFLKDGVSTQLKNAALRKLWRSNPVLACVDGLNDYDEDYRTVETFADGIRSSWQVGKGYSWMSEVEEKLEAVADAVDTVATSEDAAEPASDVAEPDAPEGADAQVAESAPPEDEEPHALTAQAPEVEGGQEGSLSLAVPQARDDDDTVPSRTQAVQEPARPARRRVRFT